MLILLFYEKRTQAVVRFWAQKSVSRHFNENFFQTCLGLILLSWGLAEECIRPSKFRKRKKFWSGCSTKKVLRWLSDFELKKLILGNFTKTVFQSSLVLFLLNWGLVEEFIPTSRVQERKEFVIWKIYEKSAQVVVRFRAQKVLSRQFHGKCFSISSWTFSTELMAGEEVYPS